MWPSKPLCSGQELHSTSVRSPSRSFRAIRIAALTLPIAAASFYFIDVNDGQVPISLWNVPLSQPQALTLCAANIKLCREQQTQYFALEPSGHRLGRVDIARLPSNFPVEDEFATGGTLSALAVQALPSAARGFVASRGAGSKWSFFGVYDGHAGWATSAYLRKNLVPTVSAAVGAVPETSGPGKHAEAVKRAFLALDANIMQTALAAVTQSKAQERLADPNAIAALAPAVAGSCALLAAYNPVNSQLLVACTGDSRAVLGRRQRDLVTASPSIARYTTFELSQDQSGKSPNEVARLNALHPNEPEMFKGLKEKGRIFGLAVTRAFGDHRWKFDTETLQEIQQAQFGSGPRPHTVSQPYLTAEPEVTETTIQKGSIDAGQTAVQAGDFAILASDGLWDHISSEAAVGVVERWLEVRRSNKGASLRDARRRAENEHATRGELPNPLPLFRIVDGYAEWTYEPDWAVVEDDNAATCLIKNVLGGKNRGFFCGLLSTYAPMSRNIRDDITVQIVFFGGVV